MDMQLAVYEFEKECCSHGITTMFHSVSMLDNELGTPMRNPENVKKLVEIIEESHSQLHLIHNRFHMRFEIDNFTQFPLMMEYLKKWVCASSFFYGSYPWTGTVSRFGNI